MTIREVVEKFMYGAKDRSHEALIKALEEEIIYHINKAWFMNKFKYKELLKQRLIGDKK